MWLYVLAASSLQSALRAMHARQQCVPVVGGTFRLSLPKAVASCHAGALGRMSEQALQQTIRLWKFRKHTITTTSSPEQTAFTASSCKGLKLSSPQSSSASCSCLDVGPRLHMSHPSSEDLYGMLCVDLTCKNAGHRQNCANCKCVTVCATRIPLMIQRIGKLGKPSNVCRYRARTTPGCDDAAVHPSRTRLRALLAGSGLLAGTRVLEHLALKLFVKGRLVHTSDQDALGSEKIVCIVIDRGRVLSHRPRWRVVTFVEHPLQLAQPTALS